MSEITDIAPGDRVIFKIRIGSPWMVVVAVNQNQNDPEPIQCAWFDTKQRYRMRWFPRTVLEHIS